jgi:hypothetical protein
MKFIDFQLFVIDVVIDDSLGANIGEVKNKDGDGRKNDYTKSK